MCGVGLRGREVVQELRDLAFGSGFVTQVRLLGLDSRDGKRGGKDMEALPMGVLIFAPARSLRSLLLPDVLPLGRRGENCNKKEWKETRGNKHMTKKRREKRWEISTLAALINSFGMPLSYTCRTWKNVRQKMEPRFQSMFFSFLQ